jgi:YD repeat-containing protein
MATSTDANGKVTSYGYEGGDLSSTTDPLGNTTTYFTDAGGRVLAMTDPLSRQMLASVVMLDPELHGATPGRPRTKACGPAQGDRRGQCGLGSRRGLRQAGILLKYTSSGVAPRRKTCGRSALNQAT